MAIRVTCACGKQVSVKDELAGKRIKCPACGRAVAVPGADVEELTEVEAEPPPAPSSAMLGTDRKPKKKRRREGPSFLARNWPMLLVGVVIVFLTGFVITAVVVWVNRPKPSREEPVARAEADQKEKMGGQSPGPDQISSAGKQTTTPQPTSGQAQPTQPAAQPMPPTTPPEPPLTEEEKRVRAAFAVRLIHFGPARFEQAEYRGRTLTGVVVEVEGLAPNAKARFDAKAATASLAEGPETPSAVMFVAGGREGLAPTAEVLPGTNGLGGDIFIGKDRFQTLPVGSFGRVTEAKSPQGGKGRVQLPANAGVISDRDFLLSVPLIVEKGGGVEYGFLPGRKVRLGFLFAGSVDALKRVKLLGYTLNLDPSMRAGTPAPAAKPTEPDPPSTLGEVVHRLQGHTKEVTAVLFTRDGRRAVTGSDDRTLRVWDLQAGTELRRIKGGNSNFVSVALLPDGRRAVTASATKDSALTIWDLETGQVVRRLEPKERNIFGSIAVSGDGRRLLAAGLSSFHVWDLQTNRELRKVQAGGGLPGGGGLLRFGVAISFDGRLGYVADFEANLRVFDLGTGKRLRQFGNAKKDLWMSTTFTPDGKFALTGSGGTLTINDKPVPIDYGVRLWDMTARKLLRTCKGHSADVRVVAVARDSKRGLSAGADGLLILWNLQTGEEIGRATAAPGTRVRSLAFSPDGKRALAGSADGTVRLWNLPEGAP